jgi:peptidoglycan/LPS O-acetylase OafA/YrhL
MAIMKYPADIDGLRALAVLPVVFYHLKVRMITGGYVGVDI